MSGQEIREAVCNGDIDKLKRLIQEGGNVNYISNEEDKDDNNDLWPPILWAVKKEQIECLKILLENNANINLSDESGNSALHKAAYLGNIECIKILLNFGAKIDCKNNMNQTPKELAEIFDKKEVIEYFDNMTSNM